MFFASKFFPICMDFPVGFELGRQGVQLSFQSRLGIWVCVSAALSNSLLYTSELAGRLRNSRGFVQKWWISMGFTWNLGDTAFLSISIHFYPFLSISFHFYPFVLWTRFVPKLRKLEIHKVWLQAIEFGASHDSLQAVVSRLVQAFGAGLGMAPLTAELMQGTYLFGYWNTWKHEHTTSGLLEHRRGGSSPDAPQLLPSFFRKELSTGLGGILRCGVWEYLRICFISQKE